MELTFKVLKNTLIRTDAYVVNAGEDLIANFTFSKDWDNTTKYVVVNAGDSSYVTGIEGDTCYIPGWFVTAGKVSMVVNSAEGLMYTNDVRILIRDGYGRILDGEDDIDTLFDTMTNALMKLKENITDLQGEVDTLFDVLTGALNGLKENVIDLKGDDYNED